MLTLRFLLCLCSAPCAACWTLSNITAGDHAQIAQCIDSGCMGLIMEFLRDDSTPSDIQQEAAWCMNNAITGSSVDRIVGLVDRGVFEVLAVILGLPSGPVVRRGIESLTRILIVGKDRPSTDDGSLDPNPFVTRARAACLKALRHLRDCGDHDDDLAPLVEFFPAIFVDAPEAPDRSDEGEEDEEDEKEEDEDEPWDANAAADADLRAAASAAGEPAPSVFQLQPDTIAQAAAGAAAGSAAVGSDGSAVAGLFEPL